MEQYQRPIFNLIGSTEKRFALLEDAHNVGAVPTEMRREVLAWLDKHL